MVVHREINPAEAADRLAIRELFDGYAHCADRRDAEGQKALKLRLLSISLGLDRRVGRGGDWPVATDRKNLAPSPGELT